MQDVFIVHILHPSCMNPDEAPAFYRMKICFILIWSCLLTTCCVRGICEEIENLNIDAGEEDKIEGLKVSTRNKLQQTSKPETDLLSKIE